MTEGTIKLGQNHQRFAQGVAAGSQVNEAHADVNWQGDHALRSKLYWFYVGALAAGEHGCTDAKDFEAFIMGASLRAPESTDDDDETED